MIKSCVRLLCASSIGVPQASIRIQRGIALICSIKTPSLQGRGKRRQNQSRHALWPPLVPSWIDSGTGWPQMLAIWSCPQAQLRTWRMSAELCRGCKMCLQTWRGSISRCLRRRRIGSGKSSRLLMTWKIFWMSSKTLAASDLQKVSLA